MRYTITLAGIDVTEWVREQPTFENRKSEIGGFLELQNVDLMMDNTSDLFVPGGTRSIVDADFVGDPVLILDNLLIVYEGEVKAVTISDNGRTAQIYTTNRLNRKVNAALATYTDELYTFAELSERLYGFIGVEVDNASYTRAKTKQTALLMQGRIQVTPQSQTTVQQLQYQLASIGMCRHYFVDNKAYMEYYDVDDVRTIAHTFTDEDLIDVQTLESIERDVYDGYDVVTQSGTASKLGTFPLPSINADSTQTIMIPTIETGINIGEQWIKTSAKERTRITASLNTSTAAKALSFQSAFRITSDVMGFLRDYEITAYDGSGQIRILIEGESI